MTERNTFKSQRRNQAKATHSGQPEPLSGSHKRKKAKQVSQTDGEG
ncbi:small acid-soluble spore protein P [Shouchella shacheensis]|nr:small acid-soluble spore protein P [Shouchella shacheensis]